MNSRSSWSVRQTRYPPPPVVSAPTWRGSRTGRATRWSGASGELDRGWGKPPRRRAGRHDERAAGYTARRGERLRLGANRLRTGSSSPAERDLTHSAQTSECSRGLRRRPPPQSWRWPRRGRRRPVRVVTTCRRRNHLVTYAKTSNVVSNGLRCGKVLNTSAHDSAHVVRSARVLRLSGLSPLLRNAWKSANAMSRGPRPRSRGALGRAADPGR